MFSLLLSGCTIVHRTAVSPPDKVTADSLREAVFNYLLQGKPAGPKNEARTYFLCLEGQKDPDESFLERFKSTSAFPVKPCSAARYELDPESILLRGVDKETGKTGLTFSIHQITWFGRSHADVELSGEGYASIFTFRRKGKDWFVVKKRITTVAEHQHLRVRSASNARGLTSACSRRGTASSYLQLAHSCPRFLAAEAHVR